MKAIEISGVHIGRMVRVTWTTAKGRKREVVRKITKVTHYPAGDVVLLQSAYYADQQHRIPFDADVEFI